MGEAGDDRGPAPTGPNEPWREPPPPAADENPYRAPEARIDPPPSALRILGKIVLVLLGVGAVLVSSFIAFFAVCLAAISATAPENFGVGLVAGCIAGGSVLIGGIWLLNRLFSKKRRNGSKA